MPDECRQSATRIKICLQNKHKPTLKLQRGKRRVGVRHDVAADQVSARHPRPPYYIGMCA